MTLPLTCARVALLTVLSACVAHAQPGTVDPNFSPDFGAIAPSISTMARQPNGQVLLAGRLFEPIHDGVVRLHTDGSQDLGFATAEITAIRGIRPQSDGGILVFGSFPLVGEVYRGGLARLEANGGLDESFFPAINGDIFQVVAQADGGILVAGSFTYDPRNLVRLHPDGHYDRTFAVGTGADQHAVTALALQADGKIVAGGMFQEFNGHPARHLVRLHSDGTMDTSFQPDFAIDGSIFPVVHELICLPEGKVLINANINIEPGVYQQRWLRLRADGTMDASFEPEMFVDVPAVVQAKGKLLGGEPLIRLDATGATDHSFPPIELNGAGGNLGTITALALEPGGDILVSGQFGHVGGVARPGLARIANDSVSAAGSLEFSEQLLEVEESVGRVFLRVRRVNGNCGRVSVNFSTIPGPAIPVADFLPVSGLIEFADAESGEKLIELVMHDDLRVEPDRAVTIALANPLGGAVLGTPASMMVLVRDDDIDFNFTADTMQVAESAGVASVTVQRTGRLDPTSVQLITFDSTAESPADYDAVRTGFHFAQGELEKSVELLIRDDPWGEPDEEFQVELWQSVGAGLSKQSGVLTVRIHDDDRPGSMDPSFDPGSGPMLSDGSPGSLEALLIQDDGKILVSGRFGSFNGTAAGSLVRLNSDGSVDPEFNAGSGATFGDAIPNEPGLILSLASQTDGRLLVGGRFWNFNGFSRTGLVRLNPGGSVDDTFNLGGGITDDASMEFIDAIAVQPDQRILVAWKRLHPNVTDAPPVYGVLRVLADGRRDPSFGENGIVLVDPSNVIIFAPRARLGVSTLDLQPDGSILLGGQFLGIKGTPAGGIARLLTSGLWDPSFRVGSGTRPPGGEGHEGIVKAIQRQPDGRLLVGGFYTWLNDRPALSLARLREDGAFDESFQPQVGLWGEDFNWVDNSPLSSGISDFALQSSGQIIVAGKFYRLNPEGQQDSFSNPISLARLNYDGSIDPHFYSTVPVRKMAVHTDGSIFVIGDFVPGIARLNSGRVFRVSSARRVADQLLRLTIEVPVARDFLLMASPDLATWRARQILALEAGTHEIDVPASAAGGHEFFQVLAFEP